MIKASGVMRGRPMLLLGLSGENMTRLVAGEPIAFDAAALGFDGHVVIVYGHTEADIVDMVASHGVEIRGGGG